MAVTPRTASAGVAEPADGLPGLLAELDWRGMLQATTPGLAARLATGRPISGYNGFDPSGPSLHIGHLVPISGLIHLQRRGGRPIVLVGGATGMVGDPSGTSAERNLLDRETLAANLVGIRSQLERFLDFSGPSGALMVNNLDWLGRYSMLDFLRDIGKHFTIPYMLAKDSVQTRLPSGLSFTEFSYMLLQSADFLHLYRELGVELQLGGADQWGNITAGLELIRRVEGAEDGAGHGAGQGSADGESPAHGLAFPLFTDPSGAKFGKTAEGTSVWLDPQRTSPYAFYQYWLATEDADVGGRLRFFTLLPRGEIEALEAEQAAHPEARAAQRALARDITERVHGTAAAGEAIATSEAVFERGIVGLDRERFVAVVADLPKVALPPSAVLTAAGVAIASGAAQSQGEARRLIGQGGLYVNDVRLSQADAPLPEPLHGRWWVVRKGKRDVRIVERSD